MVEDNQDDAIIARRGFADAEVSVNLHLVENGEQCLAFLRREGVYSDSPIPDLILLDLNMPVMDGREVLEEMVTDEQLRSLPVIVFSTSESERDLLDMYSLRCSSYIAKPVDYRDFQRVIQQIGQYWFGIVSLPHRGL